MYLDVTVSPPAVLCHRNGDITRGTNHLFSKLWNMENWYYEMILFSTTVTCLLCAHIWQFLWKCLFQWCADQSSDDVSFEHYTSRRHTSHAENFCSHSLLHYCPKDSLSHDRCVRHISVLLFLSTFFIYLLADPPVPFPISKQSSFTVLRLPSRLVPTPEIQAPSLPITFVGSHVTSWNRKIRHRRKLRIAWHESV